MSDADSDLEFDPYEDGEEFILLDEDDDAASDAGDGTDDDTDVADDDSDVGDAADAAAAAAAAGSAAGVDVHEVVAEADRLLPARLTTFEYARVLTTRADAISRGSEPLVALRPNDDAIAIATREIAERRCPLRIIRAYEHYDHAQQTTHKRVEYWRVAEMALPVI